MPKSTRPVDAMIGARVKRRRKEVGMSQTALAERLGVTFQQVQKYESGQNRISAGSLYEISKALLVPIGYFFKDGESQRAASPDEGPHASKTAAG